MLSRHSKTSSTDTSTPSLAHSSADTNPNTTLTALTTRSQGSSFNDLGSKGRTGHEGERGNANGNFVSVSTPLDL